MKDMIFLSAQPHDAYFIWQLEVQIHNFRKFGISDQMHILVWYPGKYDTEKWANLIVKAPEVKFFFYEDRGVNLDLYIPQLRPHIIQRHFENFPWLKDRVVFYHDSDIIFQRLPDFNQLCEGPVCWQSDTSSYIDYSYFRSKESQAGVPEESFIRRICETTGVPLEKLKEYDRNSGGAQYILKGVDAGFWKEVEEDCLKLRRLMSYGQPGSINTQFFKSENAGIQSWCADMWAVNFNLWKRNLPTSVHRELDFTWATDRYETFFTKPIFHNAGATSSGPDMFYKTMWMEQSPIGKNIQISRKYASAAYVDAINEIK